MFLSFLRIEFGIINVYEIIVLASYGQIEKRLLFTFRSTDIGVLQHTYYSLQLRKFSAFIRMITFHNQQFYFFVTSTVHLSLLGVSLMFYNWIFSHSTCNMSYLLNEEVDSNNN